MFSRQTFRAIIEGNDPRGTARCALPFLSAASWGYGLAVRTRAAAYGTGVLSSTRLPVPVVSVGNLTVGGSGKTPLVIELARLFTGLGCRVGVLSRGYGGDEPEEPLVVSDGEHIVCDDPARAGDEPILIALRAPGAAVVVCRVRARGGRHAIDSLGCDLLLLDDGFQHLALHRDLDIVVFRGKRPFGNGKLLPRGPLREPLSALSRAHLLVEIVPKDRDEASAAPQGGSAAIPLPDLPRLRAVVRPTGLETLWKPEDAAREPDSAAPAPDAASRKRDGSASAPAAEVPVPEATSPVAHVAAPVPGAVGKRVYLFSGIGSPEWFERSVRELGAEIAGSQRFPDHYAYRQEDLEGIWTRAQAAGADLIVTTEKDGVKVRSLLSREANLSLPPIPAAELVISLDFPVDVLLEAVRTRLALPDRHGGG